MGERGAGVIWRWMKTKRGRRIWRVRFRRGGGCKVCYGLD